MKNKSLLAVAFLLIQNMIGYAQDPSASFYVDHAQYITPSIYEFDVMAKADGVTSTFDLRTFQAGIYVSSTWVNGGTLSLSTAPGYSELTAPAYNGVYQWNSTDKLINCSVNYGVKPSSTTCIATTVTTLPVRVARIRATNSASFGCFTPDMKFNYVSNNSPLRLRTSFSWRQTGCTINYELFYPARTYSGVAKFNTETYSTSDADGRSPVSTLANTGNCFPILSLKLFLEGYYINGSTMQSVLTNQTVKSASYVQTDSIRMELHPVSNPGLISANVKGILMTDGTASFTLPSATNGISYYIAVYHRNSILTYSNPVTITSSLTSYDFSNAISKAYASNQKLLDPGVYGFYAGDLNQDEFIDASDFPPFDTDNLAGACCAYYFTDINGDGFVDASDFPIFDSNNLLGIFSVHP